MSKLPYFKWYPGDAETDENFRSMNDAEIGFYVRCLNHSWLNHGLPADPVERARSLREKRAYADRQWVRVGRCFSPDQNDPTRLVNRRQEEERLKAEVKSERAARSVRTRYESPTNVGTNEPPRAGGRPGSPSELVLSSDSELKNSETRDDFSQDGPDELAHRLVYGDPGEKNGLAELHWTLSDPRLCIVAARKVFIGAADPAGVLAATRTRHGEYRQYHASHPRVRGKPLQYWLSDGQYRIAPPNGDGGKKSEFD